MFSYERLLYAVAADLAAKRFRVPCGSAFRPSVGRGE